MSSSTPPDGSLDAALTIIGRTPAVLRGLIDGLGAFAGAGAGPVSGADPGEGWAPREVAAHLLDVEGIGFVERIRRVLTEEVPFIAPIDPPARLAAGGYADRALGDLLDELDRRRRDDLAWLRSLPEAALIRRGEHQVAGSFTAGELVRYWACHDLLHLRQVAQGLQDLLAPDIGNLRAFFESPPNPGNPAEPRRNAEDS